jgi:putative PIN family toxin of toxin-antitoxin system
VRAVVDTNVWVSALLSRDGGPAQIAEALGGQLTPLFCPATFREITAIGEHSGLVRRGVTTDRLRVLVARLVAVGEHFDNDPPLGPSTRDAKDDVFAALAAAARVEYLVSGDKDLLDDAAVRDYLAAAGVQLVTVREFVEVLARAG